MIACADAIYERNNNGEDQKMRDKYGRIGEVAALKETIKAALKMPWLEIYHNKIIGDGLNSVESDLIICGHSNIYVFEVKCLEGILSSTREGEWRQNDAEGAVKNIGNGFRQVRRVKKALAHYLNQKLKASYRYCRKKIISKVLFTGKNLDLSSFNHKKRSFLMLDELAEFLFKSESIMNEVPLPENTWSYIDKLQNTSVIKLINGRQYHGRIVCRKRLIDFGYKSVDEFVIFEPRGRNMIVVKSSEIKKITT